MTKVLPNFEESQGILEIVGVGPGDPELLTLKAAKAIANAEVIFFHAGRPGSSKAAQIAANYFPKAAIIKEWVYPVTTGDSFDYYPKMAEFYAACEAQVQEQLAAGKKVVLLAEGDPLLYGSAMYLADRFPTRIIPGVTSVSAGTAAIGTGLCRHEDVLTYLPGTLPVPELARRLADTQAAVIMKLGRNFANAVEALRQAGKLEEAFYVEYASLPQQRVLPVSEVTAENIPYLSVIIVPGADLRADSAGRAQNAATNPTLGKQSEANPDIPSQTSNQGLESTTPATLKVLGLGPGPDKWLTPEVKAVLAEVEHVIGYAPYVNRVPQRAGLTRHASGNTVEVERAKQALELALTGAKVAVVSGGDAGVFGMASAVFEAAQEPKYQNIKIEVLPGITAAQATAASIGAPLGGDFAIVNLSDRLKPWEVLAQRLTHLAQADIGICLYNPASRTRRTQIAKAQDLLLRWLAPETIVVIGRDIGRAEHQVKVTTLGQLEPESIDMKCLVMVCPSSTRITPTGKVWTPRFIVTNS